MNYPDNVYQGPTVPWFTSDLETVCACDVCGSPLYEGDRAHLGYDSYTLNDMWLCSDKCVGFYDWQDDERPVMVEVE